jgi:hypothetical protein
MPAARVPRASTWSWTLVGILSLAMNRVYP